MSDKIKTRKFTKDIKSIDKSANIADKMKNAYIRTKDEAQHTQQSEHSSPSDYATDKATVEIEIPNEREVLSYTIKRCWTYTSQKLNEEVFIFSSDVQLGKSVVNYITLISRNMILCLLKCHLLNIQYCYLYSICQTFC